MRFIVIAILAGLLAWCAYWWVAAAGQKTLWQELFDAQRAKGLDAEAQVSVKGFPNRLDTTLLGVVLDNPEGRWGWRAPFFQVLMLSYKPNHVIAAWPNEQSLRTPIGPVEVGSERLRASAVFEASTDLGLDRFNVEGEAIVISGVLAAQFPDLRLAATRVSSDAPEFYDIRLEALDPVLPGFKANPLALQRIRGDMTLELDRAADRHAATGAAPRPQALDVRLLSLERGNDSLEVSGKLTVGPDGFLAGTVTLALSSPALLPEFLASTGIDQKLDPFVAVALNSLAAGTGPLAVDLVFADKTAFIGPLRTRIGRAPRIR